MASAAIAHPALLGAAAVLLAAILASFYALVIERWPRGEPILAGRSICRSCSRTLPPRDLVPIVSYLWLAGRCRGCGAAIPRWLLGFELAAIGLALQGVHAVGASWLAPVTAAFGVTLLAAAVIDFRLLQIPDALSLPLIPAGLAVAAIEPRLVLLDHALGAAFGFLLLLAVRQLYQLARGREGLGLGDVKLFAAGGAWLAWHGLAATLLIASLAALTAVLALRLRGRSVAAGDAVAFGPFLALGIWLVWLYLPPV